MRHILAVAAIFVFSVPVCGQQDKPPEQARPIPIPTNPGPVEGVPLPSPRPGDVIGGPLPNWRLQQSYSGVLVASGPLPPARPCSIFTVDGKKYRYLEGGVPPGIRSQKTYSSADLNKLTSKGGVWRLLANDFTAKDLNAARFSCIAGDKPASP
jgi:hypothetical protein